jgi:hypothetical protein
MTTVEEVEGEGREVEGDEEGRPDGRADGTWPNLGDGDGLRRWSADDGGFDRPADEGSAEFGNKFGCRRSGGGVKGRIIREEVKEERGIFAVEDEFIRKNIENY